MKIKYFLLLVTLSIFGISNVNASSIEYNLTIDDKAYFYEVINYEIEYSDIDRSVYNYPTEVLDSDIYFDNDRSVKYKKTKKNLGSKYLITLKNDYGNIFLSGQRIVNECFKSFDYNITDSRITFDSESPFFCSKRADKITIKITSELDVISSNADIINNNTYIWNVNSKNFNLRFSAGIPELENDPMEDLNGYGPENSNENESIDEETVENTDDNNQEKSISIGTFIVIGAVISIISVIAIIILKAKKKKLNQI